ncbi:TATA box-binding protein-associated factor RNA polymerase I subunit B isoform X1 [Neodiprion fabricii]|uniref:TATA box-binding protein-associated factor RNA polymerase I subunit B isoform X1 n=1 Tax=Neodiprion fabricii TaxID=2872261 RepID=UPI001ED9368A|nr:TATA box-binding protein-associated factor RNA polymerase I subunit B isoform X1 [Neodiprion fabricii]
MDNCKVCRGTVFYKEAGFYFCSECQTQNEERREAILEQRFEGIRVTQRKIANDNSEKTDQSAQWSTWELYNFVLIGLTDELIELGASSDIKLTVLQLWAFYLGKVEVAFTSKICRKVPKLARRYHKRDADIIYGKLKSRKRKRSRASSASSIISSQLSEGSSNRELSKHKRLLYKAEYERLVSSQTGSESDALSLVSQSLASIRSGGSQSSVSVEKLKYSKHAKSEAKRVKQLSKKLPRAQRVKYQQTHVTTKYRTGPYVITPMKIWAILYLALRIHDQSIHLADMLRYSREGHLSYYRLDHLLPAEIALTESDVKFLTQSNEITHKGMRRTCAEMAKFLFVSEMSCPDFPPLIQRYCTDLNLPKGILIYTKRLVALSAPTMVFTHSDSLIPNYEGRAMAFIIVVLKILLGMDGITEYEISRIAEKINSWGTTGCVAWDGQSMAAGTTTGGLNGKMVGRIGDSPFLGCGTFANNLAGCSMTGHGETIAKLGLSRKIVEEVTAGSCPEDTLKLNIDAMYHETNCSSGGIVLKKNGCWGVHFSTPRMPYAVAKKNVVTFGAKPSERKTVKYFDPDSRLPCRCK